MATVKSPDVWHGVRRGQHVGFTYRSARPQGVITGIAKRGTTRATTEYSIRPDAKYRHTGEGSTVPRHGNKFHSTGA